MQPVTIDGKLVTIVVLGFNTDENFKIVRPTSETSEMWFVSPQHLAANPIEED